jgi:hypothetical protein
MPISFAVAVSKDVERIASPIFVRKRTMRSMTRDKAEKRRVRRSGMATLSAPNLITDAGKNDGYE